MALTSKNHKISVAKHRSTIFIKSFKTELKFAQRVSNLNYHYSFKLFMRTFFPMFWKVNFMIFTREGHRKIFFTLLSVSCAVDRRFRKATPLICNVRSSQNQKLRDKQKKKGNRKEEKKTTSPSREGWRTHTHTHTKTHTITHTYPQTHIPGVWQHSRATSC